MKISHKQKEIIDSLVCERLAIDDTEEQYNFKEIETFQNDVNSGLVAPLQNEAYEHDAEKKIAYYLVKSPEGDILFYFSLKCGQLYDKALKSDLYKSLQKVIEEFKKMKDEEDTSEEDRENILTILELLRNKSGVSKSDFMKIKKKCSSVDDFEKLLDDDDNEKVGATYSGIEILHFCANTDKRNVWDNLKLDQKIGPVVFWIFLVPNVLEAMMFVGCEYLYLFAADNSPKDADMELVNYYKVKMGFEEPEERRTTVPLYDLFCPLLYQKTKELERKQEEFFNDFCHDIDAV